MPVPNLGPDPFGNGEEEAMPAVQTMFTKVFHMLSVNHGGAGDERR